MSFENPRQSFEDILQQIQRIQSLLVGLSKEVLAVDDVKRAAIERWLQVLTEAAFRLGKQPEQYCPGPDWAGIRGLGNQLRHAYDRIDIDLIWELVTRELEPLKQAVTQALDALPPEAED